MNLLEQAIQFAVRAHEGQIDAGDNQPHIIHCFEVFRRVREMLDEAESKGTLPTKYTRQEIEIAAILHDTVEDTPATLDQIEELFGKNVRTIVDSVTRRGVDKNKESYRDFIYRAQADEGGIIVKIADLSHNMSRNHKIKSASWRMKLDYKYSIAMRVLNDSDHPTWEQASYIVIHRLGIPHFYLADPNGKEIEVTEAEFRKLTVKE